VASTSSGLYSYQCFLCLLIGLYRAQGKGKGKGKGKSTKSSEIEKPAADVNTDDRKTEIVKLKALDVFAGCGGIELVTCSHLPLAPAIPGAVK